MSSRFFTHQQHRNTFLHTPSNSSVAECSSSSNNGGGGSNGSKRESPIRAVRLSEAPRTPTPFKKALADVYQRREPLSRTVSSPAYPQWRRLVIQVLVCSQPQTPTKLVEDLTEIMKKEHIDMAAGGPAFNNYCPSDMSNILQVLATEEKRFFVKLEMPRNLKIP